MNVSIIGLGYIGLPTAALLSSKGIRVNGVDTNEDVVKIINSGKSPIIEPGLESILTKVVNKELLKAYSQPKKSDVFIIAVPTPFKEDKKPDLSFIESALESIAPCLELGNLIILESTVPVGTTEKIRERIIELRQDLNLSDLDPNIDNGIYIAHCPERVLPGNIINELVKNDRIIGGITVESSKKAKEFYELFVDGDCEITDSRTAELSKLVENSFRDVNIAFANELSVITDKLNIDVWECIRLANLHPRVEILQPGPGVGGHCIAVEPWFIIDSVPDESILIRTARAVNDGKPEFVLKKVKESVQKIGKQISEISIACLGLSFKKDIDDFRESPSIHIVKELLELGFKELILIEPNASKFPDILEPSEVVFTKSIDCVYQSDIVLLLVDHTEFQKIKIDKLQDKEVIDTKGFWLKK